MSVLAIVVAVLSRHWEILKCRHFHPLDLQHGHAYTINSSLWKQWFEAEHDARWQSIESTLEDRDDNKEYKAF